MELCKYAVEQSRNYVPERLELAQAHNGTGINNSQLDYNMVFLSAILISWAVRMRKVKSDECQCWAHKKCQDTRKMHSEIYDQWIEVVEEALVALRAGRPGQ
jgi:hypothetical protein